MSRSNQPYSNNNMSRCLTLITIALASLSSTVAFSSSSSLGMTSSSLHMVLMDPETLTQRQTRRRSKSNYHHQIQTKQKVIHPDTNTGPVYLDNNHHNSLFGDLETSIQYTDETSSHHTSYNHNNNNLDDTLVVTNEKKSIKSTNTVSSSRIRSSISSSSRHEKLLKPISSVKKVTRKKESKSSTNRSSTMPGFAERSNTGRIRRFHDGMKVFEQQSGRTDVRKMLTKSDATVKGKQANAEAMYLTSASVPESLVAFTSEIHRVSHIHTHTSHTCFIPIMNDTHPFLFSTIYIYIYYYYYYE